MPRSEIAESLEAFQFTHVYIIYSADVLADTDRDIEEMSPALHILAGWGEGYRPTEREIAKAASEAFTDTEGNEQYDYGYLVAETNNPRYAPADEVDTSTTRCSTCGQPIEYDEDNDLAHVDESLAMDHAPTVANAGRHRKWVGQLTRDEWRAFAESYGIELTANDIPEEFDATLGSLTEMGHLDAISVRMDEGWEPTDVIDAQAYVSFGRFTEET